MSLQLLKDYLKRIVTHPIVTRAFHAFWQTFLVVWLFGIPAVLAVAQAKGIGEGWQALIALTTAAGAAAFSAAKTYLVQLYKNWRVNIPEGGRS